MTEAMVDTICMTLQVLGVFAFVAFFIWIVAQR
jgi:preprotein translocase subunit SecE